MLGCQRKQVARKGGVCAPYDYDLRRHGMVRSGSAILWLLLLLWWWCCASKWRLFTEDLMFYISIFLIHLVSVELQRQSSYRGPKSLMVAQPAALGRARGGGGGWCRCRCRISEPRACRLKDGLRFCCPAVLLSCGSLPIDVPALLQIRRPAYRVLSHDFQL